MSMFSALTGELRDRADELRMLAGGMGAPYIVPETKLAMGLAMTSAASDMCKAAATIERLSDKLQGMVGTRWRELFGTPERAARTLSIMQRCELGLIGNCLVCEMHDSCIVRDGDYDALLKWLTMKGESDGDA